MSLNFPDLYGSNDVIRFQFRANHIYILFFGPMNTLVGLYLAGGDKAGIRVLFATPALFLAAFLVEPPRAVPDRPISLLAVVLSAAGVFLHFLSGWSIRIT